ncbi:NAD(P)/FAD-dependent oxidoreductase [Methylomonas methanica]|uniref:Flavocytochrome c sulphide dehydrogenase flavin-binding protein n=1 Tax=Methylomonas methanica (strain DSM 25384 / MC09) TaxID=857087 RepID=F9ZYC4_METMM|nr:NAD(P)/FAD-dependent oxidoreductase [Methylomonas methanica]AEG01029.1 Flavocytochrome c sulphide dehydrogenase flavin-binding protein [Methylomonas methanica MC09]
MADITRRHFLQVLSAAAGALSGCDSLRRSGSKAHVVVVGGGFGGATAAKTLRSLDADLNITLIEPKANYITCPGSNWLFAGLKTLPQLSVDYQALTDRHRVRVVADNVASIDRDRRRLQLSGGQTLAYDRLILSPGIAFQRDAIAGYSPDMANVFPHAWQAGAQTLLLNRQLQAMPAGGVVLIVAPPDPYRCPPGPYERASMMACWLKQHNSRAKIIILDPKRSFSKQALFEAGWRQHFGYGTTDSMIEWHTLADNPITRLDAQARTVISDFGDRFRGDVLNIIPAQTAATLAIDAGLTDKSGWCPVNPKTAQSLFDQHIHVIGDAAHFTPIPKSAFAANSEAKACAVAVFSLLNQQEVPAPNWLNICYSLITPKHGISVAGVYQLDSEHAVAAIKGAGGTSRVGAGDLSLLEANYAQSAYRSLVNNSFR